MDSIGYIDVVCWKPSDCNQLQPGRIMWWRRLQYNIPTSIVMHTKLGVGIELNDWLDVAWECLEVHFGARQSQELQLGCCNNWVTIVGFARDDVTLSYKWYVSFLEIGSTFISFRVMPNDWFFKNNLYQSICHMIKLSFLACSSRGIWKSTDRLSQWIPCPGLS